MPFLSFYYGRPRVSLTYTRQQVPTILVSFFCFCFFPIHSLLLFLLPHFGLSINRAIIWMSFSKSTYFATGMLEDRCYYYQDRTKKIKWKRLKQFSKRKKKKILSENVFIIFHFFIFFFLFSRRAGTLLCNETKQVAVWESSRYLTLWNDEHRQSSPVRCSF